MDDVCCLSMCIDHRHDLWSGSFRITPNKCQKREIKSFITAVGHVRSIASIKPDGPANDTPCTKRMPDIQKNNSVTSRKSHFQRIRVITVDNPGLTANKFG